MPNSEISCPDWLQSKIERNQKRRISIWTLLGYWKKSLEYESDGYTNHDWCSLYSHQRISKGIKGFRNKRTRGDHPNNSVADIGWLVDCLINFFYTNNQFYFKQFILAWVHTLSKTFLFQATQFSQTVLIQTIQFSMSIDFVYTQLISKQFYFKQLSFALVQFQCLKQFHFKQFSLT